MIPPKMAAAMIGTGVPPDWSASGAVVILPVDMFILISTDPVDSYNGSARDHYND